MKSFQTSKIYQVPHRHLKRWQFYLDNFARRLIDVLAAFFGLLTLSPWFFIICIIIKRDTPGPVFYQGGRIGKGGKTFKILKFRTMYEEAASHNGARLTHHADPRITKAGRWLRDTKVNELPQLLNVLLGQMSLVGPRPEDPDVFEEWPEDYKKDVIQVRPGMTSPASLIYFDEEQKLSSSEVRKDYLENILPQKMEHDIHYLKHRTIINDLDVIFLTFIALIPKMREKRINTYILDKGPLVSFFYDFFNWFLIDLLVAIFATALSIAIWRLSSPLNVGVLNAILVAFLLAFIFSMTNVAFGLNRIAWRHARAEAVIELALSNLITIIIIGILDIFNIFPVRLPLGVILLTGLLSFIGFVTARYRERILTGLASRWLRWRGEEQQVGERVIILGAGETGIKASWFIKHGYLDHKMDLIGFVDDDLYKENLIIDGSLVLGKTVDLPEIVNRDNIDIILFAIDNLSSKRRQEILSICRETTAQTVKFRSMIESIGSVLDPIEPGDDFSQRKAQEEFAQLLLKLDDLLEMGDFEAARALIKRSKLNFTENTRE